tara:strand:+ start:270 stop:488 length:219 start_codon:yes stop_codon:yes gene_type:complete
MNKVIGNQLRGDSRFIEITPSKQAKELGLKSLTQVSELTGQSLQTLTNWFNDKPELYEVVLLGCVAKLGLVT